MVHAFVVKDPAILTEQIKPMDTVKGIWAEWDNYEFDSADLELDYYSVERVGDDDYDADG